MRKTGTRKKAEIVSNLNDKVKMCSQDQDIVVASVGFHRKERTSMRPIMQPRAISSTQPAFIKLN